MRVAAVDIGTNTTRLLVADYRPEDLFSGERVEWQDRRIVVTRLGQGVDASGRLADEAMGRTIAVLAGYGEAMRAWDVEAARAIATSAVRDATNREEFLARARLALGVRPDVISGAEEAELSFRGATSGIASPAPHLVIDVGGGSTEFVMGRDELEYAVSVDIGSVRLTERHFGDPPVPSSEVDAARAAADAELERVDLPATPGTVIGVAGSFTALAAIVMDLPQYDAVAVHGSVITADHLRRLIERLATMTLEQIEAIPSLDPARAPVILGGGIVAERALHRSGADQLVVSETDILDGIAMSIPGTS